MIEDRLRQTFDRVATGGPDEAGAFDRFQRRQARRSRRAAGSTGLVLVVLLGLAVALPTRRGPDRPPVAGTTGRLVLVSAGEPVDRRWFPGPLVAAAPNQGFEADVPAGWEVRPTWKGFELRPAPPRSCGAGWPGRWSSPRPTCRRSTSQADGSGTRTGASCPRPPCPGPRPVLS